MCVASIYREGEDARLRKFATLTEYQGRGIGSYVLKHIMSELKGLGVRSLWCDARATAVTFYEQLGFEISGSEFNKSSLSYYKMTRVFSEHTERVAL